MLESLKDQYQADLGVGESRRVGEVEEFAAHLEAKTFADGEVSHEDSVPIEEAKQLGGGGVESAGDGGVGEGA
jgi:hypothetical protein